MHSSQCLWPLLGLAPSGHLPQSQWLILSFPAAKEGSSLAGQHGPLLGGACLSQPQFTTFLLPDDP